MPIQAGHVRVARALIPLPPLSSTTATTSASTDTSSSTTTTTTTSSTSATSTSSSSSSTASSTSSTSSSSTTSASSTSDTLSTSSTVPLTTATLSRTTTNAGGGIVTITSTQVAPNPTSTTATTSAASTSSKQFFQNTGAVAGVFTVVGLIAVVIVVAIIINIVRRRQAQNFDREIAEAAAEAAAARAPAFLDDETDSYGPGGYGGAYGKFSDVSHGTFSQPPMTESYGMREMVPGEVYDPAIYGAPGAAGIGAGAAGIGVARARSRRDFAAGLQEGASPYPAFAGPRYDMHSVSRSPPPGFAPPSSPERDLLDAAGLGGRAAGVHRGPPQQSYQMNYSDLNKARSLTAPSSDSSNHSQSYRPFNPPSALQPGVQRNASLQTTILPYASGGSEEPPHTSPLPNPFASSSGESDEHHDGAESEPEEEEPRRVLRVANE